MIEVRDLDAREIHRFYGAAVVEPIKGYVARRGLRTVALGGLAIGVDGRVWGFIDFRPGYRLRALYRYTLKLLDWAADAGIPEIFVARDDQFSTSERLLTRTGFMRTGETMDGHEIWAWRNKKVKSNG